MPLPLLFLLFVAQGQTAPKTVLRSIPTTTSEKLSAVAQQQTAPTSAAQQPFSAEFLVTEMNRIALSPRVDGILDEEEWDPLATGSEMKSFFQWEPGKLHFAGQVPEGHDLVASFDLKANGWLIGKDNLEVRLSSVDGKATMSCRVLDGTGISGPKWVDLPGMVMASSVSSKTDSQITTYEASVADLGLGIIPTEANTKLMVRMDDPLSSDAASPAYLPRKLSPVTLMFQRSAALSPGLKFNTENTGRSSVSGEGIKLRLTFNGNNSMKLQKLEMHSEGFAKNDTNQLTVPFPKFDEKGRSYIDYMTSIVEGSPVGYRVLKATLTTSENIPAVMEACYRVGPVIDFDIPRQSLAVAPLDRSVRFSFYAKSNSSKAARGEVSLSVPEPLRILNGTNHKINILTNRGSDRQTFEIFFPPNTSGTYPVKFSAVINGKKIEQVSYITIGGL